MPADKRPTCGPRCLSRFEDGAPQRALGLSFLTEGNFQLADGAETPLASIKTTLGRRSNRTSVNTIRGCLHGGSRRYRRSMQSDIAEKAALHDRALIVVNTAEPETTQLLCDTLRGQIAVEASSPWGSEQV